MNASHVPAQPLVSVIIPCFNEKEFIQECLESVIRNDYSSFEVLVIDGGSLDGTLEVLRAYCGKCTQVRVLANPRRIIPTALNIGIQESRGRVLIRMDAHAVYPPDFISKSVSLLEETGADAVGGRVVPRARTAGVFAGAIAAALAHPFGVGNSTFRVGSDTRRQVDTVFSGCYRKSCLEKVFPLNPRVRLSEDLLMHRRIRQSGGRIVFCPEITCTYLARSTFFSFCGHNWRNGVWSVLPIAYDRGFRVSPRHLIPLAFVLTILTLAVAAALHPFWRMPLELLLAAYGTACVISSLHASFRARALTVGVLLIAVFPSLHVIYGLGTLWGLLVTPLHWSAGGSSDSE